MVANRFLTYKVRQCKISCSITTGNVSTICTPYSTAPSFAIVVVTFDAASGLFVGVVQKFVFMLVLLNSKQNVIHLVHE